MKTQRNSQLFVRDLCACTISELELFQIDICRVPEFTFQYYLLNFPSVKLSLESNHLFYTEGSHSGVAVNGFYEDGEYTQGSLNSTFTLNSTSSTVSF